MMFVRVICLIVLFILYGFTFISQEQQAQSKDISLEFDLPPNFYTIASGYLKQLVAEMLFIKTSAFLGGRRAGAPPETYENALGNNFMVMTSLYPGFIDPYYFCQAYLPYISQEAAERTNTVLETGIAAYPRNFVLQFFHATNFILYMNEPQQSAKSFAETAAIPGAPPYFGHLAAVFSAQGGDLIAGLISLNTLLAAEKDEAVRTEYKKEIAIFEQAIQVNTALIAYQKKYNAPPDELKQLIPEFIQAIPDIKDTFVLVYSPPTLRLERPLGLKRMRP